MSVLIFNRSRLGGTERGYSAVRNVSGLCALPKVVQRTGDRFFQWRYQKCDMRYATFRFAVAGNVLFKGYNVDR
jgi:hypothetical protein